MSRMKIVAGLGNAEDFPQYIRAGADEVFVGYVPFEYMNEFGRFSPLNRREVVNYNVQLGAESELEILADMLEKLGGECSVAVNAPVYTRAERAYIKDFLSKLSGLGFSEFIIADEGLLEAVAGEYDIHISGEYGELNRLVVDHLCIYRPKRIIFPRQTAISEMKSLIEASCDKVPEFEAFALNEKCHYTGAYCSSRHCDELCHMCRVPYRLANEKQDILPDNSEYLISENGTEEPGCAVCAFWDLRDAGVTHLKLVSRGNQSKKTIEDIKLLKRALDILEESDSKEIYLQKIKNELFPTGCKGSCYYMDFKH